MLFIEPLLLLGVWPLACIIMFMLMMIISCALDRNNERVEVKWCTFAFGLIVFTLYKFRNGTTVDSILGAVSSWQFWQPMLIYLALGFVYSLVEFFFEVRRSVKFYTGEWYEALESSFRLDNWLTPEDEPVSQKTVTLHEAIKHSKEYPAQWVGTKAPVALQNDLCIHSRQLINRCDYSDGYGGVIKLQLSDDLMTPVPLVDKVALSKSLAAWALFWPFYLVSLVFGDLITEVFHMLASALAFVSSKFVKLAFSDVFKI